MILQRLRADIALDMGLQDPASVVSWRKVVPRALFASRLQAVLLLRLAQLLGRVLHPGAAAALKWLNGVVTGCDIAWEADIGEGLQLFHPAGVVVGPNVTVGKGCTLMQHVTLGHDHGGSPCLGDDVVVGPGACVLGPIVIGDGARIGANSVVTKDVPAGALALGIPARIRVPTSEPGEAGERDQCAATG